jgi:hypothetical protein
VQINPTRYRCVVACCLQHSKGCEVAALLHCVARMMGCCCQQTTALRRSHNATTQTVHTAPAVSVLLHLLELHDLCCDNTIHQYRWAMGKHPQGMATQCAYLAAPPMHHSVNAGRGQVHKR